MITQITDELELIQLEYYDIYEAKIKTLHTAYGMNYPFCRFFRQDDSLIISQLDRDFVVAQYSHFGAAELAEFLRANRATGVFLSAETLDALLPYIRGEYLFNNLMEFSVQPETGHNALLDPLPKLDEVYNILCTSFTLNYETWLTDVSHRVRHDISRVYLYDGKTTATVLYDEDDIVFITQVATSPHSRGQGLAKTMLHEIAAAYPGKSVRLVCRDAMLGFYENAGFTRIGSAAQIYRLDL